MRPPAARSPATRSSSDPVPGQPCTARGTGPAPPPGSARCPRRTRGPGGSRREARTAAGERSASTRRTGSSRHFPRLGGGPEVDHNGLELGVLVHRLSAGLAAPARLLVAAERQSRVAGLIAVDPHLAGLQGRGHPGRSRNVLCPHARPQPESGVVGRLQHLLVGVERDRGYHRAEYLLAGDPHVAGGVDHDGGLDEVTVVAPPGSAGHDLDALLTPETDVPGHAIKVLLRDEGTHLRLVVQSGADLQRLRVIGNPGDNVVIMRPLNIKAGAGDAALALADESGHAGSRDRGFEVRVGKDDVRCFPAQLERYALERASGVPDDLLAYLR